MKSNWTMISVAEMTIAYGFWMVYVKAAEVQHVHLGSTVTLGCNISYIYPTTWFKHNPDETPTVVLSASLRDGNPFPEFQLSSRFSVWLVNRSLALTIPAVEETDLGLYFCIGILKTQLSVGAGTTIQVSSPGSVQFVFYDWYCVVVSVGLLILMLVMCVTHWKAQPNTNRNAVAS